MPESADLCPVWPFYELGAPALPVFQSKRKSDARKSVALMVGVDWWVVMVVLNFLLGCLDKSGSGWRVIRDSYHDCSN